jgi:hypothetical protein
MAQWLGKMHKEFLDLGRGLTPTGSPVMTVEMKLDLLLAKIASTVPEGPGQDPGTRRRVAPRRRDLGRYRQRPGRDQASGLAQVRQRGT